MTNEEFSSEFDVLVNNFPAMTVDGISNHPYDNIFTEYEKSVFLTQAQYNVVVNLYNGNMNGEPFETTEQQRRYLNELITTKTLNKIPPELPENYNELSDEEKAKYALTLLIQDVDIDNRSVFFQWPNDVLFTSYEELRINSDDECIKNKRIEVVPVTQDEMHRIRKDPFRGPNKRRALRLTLSDDIIEVVAASFYDVASYKLRYIRKPKPIILEDFDEESMDIVSLEGYSKFQECELHPSIHRYILTAAVELAMTARKLSSSRATQQSNDEQQAAKQQQQQERQSNN